jgi:ATP-binding cassette subfamily C protein CydD
MRRETLILRDTLSSAELAALHTQKLPLLMPYLLRYRPAMLRVRVIPVIFLVLVASVSWVAALVLLLAGPLIPLFMALVGMAAKEASSRQMAEIGDMNRLLIDRIAALPDARLLGGARRVEADFGEAAEGLRARTMAVLRIAFLSSTVLELFSAIGVALVAVYVGFSLLGEITIGTWGAPLTLGQGVFILLLAPEFFQPLRDLAAAWHDKAAAEAVMDEMATLEDRAPSQILGAAQPAQRLPGPATIRLHGVIVRRGAREIALPDLDIAPSEAVALTGESGAGKSTLLDAITGLAVPEAGRITVAGVALEAGTADAWRARCAMVPQGVHVPDVTLRAYLDPRGQADDPGPGLALANAEEIVRALPDGLETRLGETGAGVSGGELRRLMLARAFLSGADVILADEPTADLDAGTGRQIIDALRALREAGATLVVATHDPALIAAMDRSVAVGGRT